MARENLRYALKAIEVLREKFPQECVELLSRIGVTTEEWSLWQRVIDKMYLPYYAKEGVYLQDDGFLMRKPWDDSRIPIEKRHLLYDNYHPLFIYRQQMCKQADLIFALQLLNSQFDIDTLKRNYDFYQARTSHHSSLSASVFGMLACRFGRLDEAYASFAETARMDLDDTHGDEYAGIHAANMAGTWQSIVFGFGGLRLADGMPEFSPQIVPAWKSYTFNLQIKNCHLRVHVSLKGVEYSLVSGSGLEFKAKGKKVLLQKEGDLFYEEL